MKTLIAKTMLAMALSTPAVGLADEYSYLDAVGDRDGRIALIMQRHQVQVELDARMARESMQHRAAAKEADAEDKRPQRIDGDPIVAALR